MRGFGGVQENGAKEKIGARAGILFNKALRQKEWTSKGDRGGKTANGPRKGIFKGRHLSNFTPKRRDVPPGEPVKRGRKSDITT